ncbi:DHA2 family efflux MFS transporter permease subunit [Companilactobacillus mishanensis]|uniref:Multidrug efflux MFS transporter n=1 Tax=Companilactobacillus mishanensis TaxID=2486008 RepID=A0A5P0ZI99_9LACO|nr:DHA2 family efflux MFS transporter permease subunit [Companilactobacillus mishanensis]MQS52803.1 multidrug efflux MFS transporter [Companilactobacillus mishanensis]
MEQKLNSKLILSIIATGLMSFCGVVVETATNVTFPTLMNEFNVNTSAVQWMTTGYLLVASIMMPLSAYLKHNFTSKKLFITAAVLFLIGLIADATAPIFPVLVLGRIIQGIGAGIALPLMFNIILEQAPSSKIGLLMGIGTLITAIAPAVGPTFGGLVVNVLGWRSIFIILIPIVLLALIMGSYAIHQVSEPVKTKLNIVGLLFISIAFIGLILGFSNLSSVGKNPLGFWIPMLVGIISLLLFIHFSENSSFPLIDLSVMKSKKYRQHLAAFFLVQIGALGMSFVLPNYIQLVNHKTALLAGLVVLPGAALGAIFAPLGGSILDKFGARKPIMIGIIFEILAMLLYSIFGRQISETVILIFYILFMLGMGLVMGNTMTNGLQQLPAERNADGNGWFNTVQQFAGAVGTSIVSTIVALSQNSTAAKSYAARTAIGAQNSFILLLLFLIIAMIILNSATNSTKNS